MQAARQAAAGHVVRSSTRWWWRWRGTQTQASGRSGNVEAAGLAGAELFSMMDVAPHSALQQLGSCVETLRGDGSGRLKVVKAPLRGLADGLLIAAGELVEP